MTAIQLTRTRRPLRLSVAVVLPLLMLMTDDRAVSQEPLIIPSAGLSGSGGLNEVPGLTPEPAALPPVQPLNFPAATDNDEAGEAMLRGPVHEAFAEQVNADPMPGLMITEAPPEPIEELPPDVRPDGRSVEWIPGYWAWDEDQNDFLWISGVWRDVPQGFRWLPGYWTEVTGGYQWVPGTWVSESTEEIEYLAEAPPASVERGPSGPAPSTEHIWIPGCWQWQTTRYLWRPGYWSTGYTNWVWIPARYQWTPRGYYFCSGYWDYPLENRGILFAPWAFHRRPVYPRFVRFTPHVVIASRSLRAHLWVRPVSRHYYFGDYYGTPFVNRGLMPWHQFNHRRGIDPLFVHYSRGQDRTVFYNQLNVQFNVFVNNPDRRPSRTFRDQNDWVRRQGVGQNSAIVSAGQMSGRSNERDSGILGHRLQDVVERSRSRDDGVRFVSLQNDQRQAVRQDSERLRSLIAARQSVESPVSDRSRRSGETSDSLPREAVNLRDEIRNRTGDGARRPETAGNRTGRPGSAGDPTTVTESGRDSLPRRDLLPKSDRDNNSTDNRAAVVDRLRLPAVRRSDSTAAADTRGGSGGNERANTGNRPDRQTDSSSTTSRNNTPESPRARVDRPAAGSVADSPDARRGNRQSALPGTAGSGVRSSETPSTQGQTQRPGGSRTEAPGNSGSRPNPGLRDSKESVSGPTTGSEKSPRSAGANRPESNRPGSSTNSGASRPAVSNPPSANPQRSLPNSQRSAPAAGTNSATPGNSATRPNTVSPSNSEPVRPSSSTNSRASRPAISNPPTANPQRSLPNIQRSAPATRSGSGTPGNVGVRPNSVSPRVSEPRAPSTVRGPETRGNAAVSGRASPVAPSARMVTPRQAAPKSPSVQPPNRGTRPPAANPGASAGSRSNVTRGSGVTSGSRSSAPAGVRNRSGKN